MKERERDRDDQESVKEQWGRDTVMPKERRQARREN